MFAYTAHDRYTIICLGGKNRTPIKNYFDLKSSSNFLQPKGDWDNGIEICSLRVLFSAGSKNPCKCGAFVWLCRMYKKKLPRPVRFLSNIHSFSNDSPNFPPFIPGDILFQDLLIVLTVNLFHVLNMHEIFATGRKANSNQSIKFTL